MFFIIFQHFSKLVPIGINCNPHIFKLYNLRSESPSFYSHPLQWFGCICFCEAFVTRLGKVLWKYLQKIITTNVFPMISDLEGSHTHIHTLSLTLFSLPPNCVSVAVDQTSFVLRDRTTGYSVCESLSSRPAASGEFSLFTERKICVCSPQLFALSLT